MKADPKADPKADTAAPKSPKKLMIGIAAVVALLGLGGGAWYFTQGATAAGAMPAKAASDEPPVFVPIEQFTVNLQSEEGEQYLQIQFTLEVNGVDQVELIKANMPKVRNRVLLLLSSKKASELTSVEGKKVLSNEIIAAIRQPFADKGEPQQVSDVLFTSFIIQ